MAQDLFIFQQINNLAGQWACLDALAIFLAKYFIYILLFSVFLIFFKKWKIIFQALLAAFLAKFLIVDLFKFIWERPRPFIENNVNQLLEYTGASFPSGHAALSFALSFVVYCYNKKAGVLFFIASFLISISRIFVGIHWPSDIVVGAIIGIFVGWLIVKFFRK